MAKSKVVLVDQDDNTIGTMGKITAHENGSLHRAFSVFVFNSKKELMVHQRALSKYHSPGLWTNTCCSHPKLNEDIEMNAHQRMLEEMGFDCDFTKAFTFLYKADVGQGLIEHEFDHVFIGVSDMQPEINPEEVEDWKYMSMESLRDDIEDYPENYTEWFKIAFEKVEEYLENNQI
jgi:isopentenyl-diphosphate delta-isomerase